MTQSSETGRRLAQQIQREAEMRDRRTKIWLLMVSLLTILFLAGAALRENVFSPWRLYQKQYAHLLESKAADERGRKLSRDFKVEMRQVVLPSLGVIDRCVSCHNGVDDPRMSDQPNPHRTHPGRYLEWHEVNRFGCTTCHRGQGRALDFRDAKAEDRHWDYPLLPVELSQSSCGLCHSAREVAEHGGEVFAAGAALFEAKGCRSCHKLSGRGGNLGPSLDNEGLKVRGNLPMAAVRGPHTVPQWLMEHFADPERIVAGSRMPPPGLSRSETFALTSYLLSLQQRDLPASYLTPERHLSIYASANPEPMTGEQLFHKFCSTCHDTGQRGRFDKFFKMFIPAVRGDTYQAIASPGYVAANIRQGRQGTIMPAWGPAAGGLSEDEIARLTSYLLGRDLRAEETRPAPLDAPATPSAPFSRRGAGEAERGSRLFAKNCSGCHGLSGEGKLGPSLNSPVFQASAGDDFLFRTISYGRHNTAMPAFRQQAGLDEAEIRDLMVFIRTLGGGARTDRSVSARQ